MKSLLPTLLLCCVLIVSACGAFNKNGSTQERLSDIKDNASNCPYYTENELDDALDFFYSSWVETFGHSIGLIYNTMFIKIDCSSSKKKAKTAYRTSGKLVKDVNVVGLAYSAKHIWFYAGEEENIKPLCKTSFIHEMVHVGISIEHNNRGDADHEGDKYEGWTREHTDFMEETKDELCSQKTKTQDF